jgi:hypothetical protein
MLGSVTLAVLGKYEGEDSRHKWLRTNSYDRTVELECFICGALKTNK